MTYPHNRIDVSEVSKIETTEGDHVACRSQTMVFGRRVSIGEDAMKFDGGRVRQGMSQQAGARVGLLGIQVR